MKLIANNSESVDIVNNWSSDACIRHMYAILYLLRYLNQEGLINTVWTPINENSGEFFTKNLSGPDFNKHINRYRVDESHYNKKKAELCKYCILSCIILSCNTGLYECMLDIDIYFGDIIRVEFNFVNHNTVLPG